MTENPASQPEPQQPSGSEPEDTNAGVEPVPGSGFWIRALARLIDMALGFVLGAIAIILSALIVGILGHPFTAEQFATASSMSVGGFLASFIGALAYGVIAEYGGRATLGKLLCNIRVLSADATAPSLRGVAIRNLGFYVDALFFGLVAAVAMTDDPLRRRLGDQWGKTLVRRRALVSSETRVHPIQTLFFIAIGAAGWTLPLTIQLVRRLISASAT